MNAKTACDRVCVIPLRPLHINAHYTNLSTLQPPAPIIPYFQIRSYSVQCTNHHNQYNTKPRLIPLHNINTAPFSAPPAHSACAAASRPFCRPCRQPGLLCWPQRRQPPAPRLLLSSPARFGGSVAALLCVDRWNCVRKGTRGRLVVGNHQSNA